MNTAPKPKEHVIVEATKPTISMTQVIDNLGSSASFSGWGPKVVGATNLLKRWS